MASLTRLETFPAIRLIMADKTTPDLEVARKWLDHCGRHHELCTRDSGPPPLPTRVIDVTSRAEPFLLETGGEHGDYVALSYCWGRVRNPDMMTIGPTSKFKTMNTRMKMSPHDHLAPNLEQHKVGIAFAAMPPTIQDAVSVSRRLGIPYLWIDAFCIVQGDEDEWNREHPRMAEIYTNAKLVIAASAADGPERGFLHTSKRASVSKILPPLLCDEPLNNRAWALSEAIFANRILHFTSSEMVWECNNSRYHEHFIENNTTWSLGDKDVDTFRVFRSHVVAQTYTREAMYRKWHDVVEQFMARQINSSPEQTYKDGLRLTALSRLARRFNHIMNHDFGVQDFYLGGIWKGDLVLSLLWSVEESLLRRNQLARWRRPETPRGPSWSWASVEGPVRFEPWLEFHDDITIISATVQHHNSHDIFDRVNSGQLVAQGLLIQGLHTCQRASNSSTFGGSRLDMCLAANCAAVAFSCDIPQTPADLACEFSCLYLGRGLRKVRPGSRDLGHASPNHIFMLLRQVEGQPMTFQRAGISSFNKVQAGRAEILLGFARRNTITIL